MHSFGIDVAKLAGVPPEVYQKAISVLDDLRSRSSAPASEPTTAPVSRDSLSEFSEVDHFIDTLKNLDLGNTTPLEALNVLAELKQIWDRNYHGSNS